MNPYVIDTRPSNVPVCLFQHTRIFFVPDYYTKVIPPCQYENQSFFVFSLWQAEDRYPVPSGWDSGKGAYPGGAERNFPDLLIFHRVYGRIVLRHKLNSNAFHKYVFLSFGKNAYSTSRTCVGVKFVSQQSESCVFRCVASAAHFFVVRGSG